VAMSAHDEAVSNNQEGLNLAEWLKGLNPSAWSCGADFKKCCKKYKKGKRCKKCPDR